MKINVLYINRFGDKGQVIRLMNGGLRIRFFNRYYGRGMQ